MKCDPCCNGCCDTCNILDKAIDEAIETAMIALAGPQTWRPSEATRMRVLEELKTDLKKRLDLN
jgi:hypothetical protein